MARIEWVEDEDATGLLAELYAAAREASPTGQVPAIYRTMSRRPDFLAVHGGGPRIFDAVEAALELAPEDLSLSRRVFREVGNLSSASILFTLAELPETPGDGLAIAFGPGVTVELARLRRAGGSAAPCP